MSRNAIKLSLILTVGVKYASFVFNFIKLLSYKCSSQEEANRTLDQRQKRNETVLFIDLFRSSAPFHSYMRRKINKVESSNI